MTPASDDLDSVGRLPTRTAVLLAAVAAVLVLLPAPTGGFVYDDHRFLAANVKLDDADVLWRAFVDPAVQTADSSYAGLWRPLRTLSFALDRLLFGPAAWGSHAVNLVLHGLQSALVVLWLRRLGVSAGAALAGALVFALHPAQVESAAWISSRGDLLATVGVLGAIVLQLDGRTRLGWCLGLLALLAKEQAVVWAPLLAITSSAAGSDRREIARAVVVPAVVTVVYVAVRHVVLPEPLQQGGLGAGTGVADVFAMVGHQAWVTMLPVGGHFDWQMPAARPVVVACVGFLALGLVLVRRLRLPALWFHVALIPTLYVQLFVPLNIRVADRFLLFALPALSWAVSLAVERCARVARPLALVLLCLATFTAFRTPAWQSDDALWRSVVAAEPAHWRGNAHLAVVAYDQGDYERAREHFRRAAEAPSGRADGQTRFRHGVVLELLAVREGLDEERGRELLTRALHEYEAAVVAYATRRTEGVGDRHLADLARLHLTYVLSDGRMGATELLERLQSPAPRVGAERRPAWESRIEQLASALGRSGRATLARDLREWGRR